VDEAQPGSRVAANLVGLERRSIRRGDALVTDSWISSRRFAARVRPARDLDHRLSERGAYELFVGSAQTLCRLKLLEEAREIAPGATALAEVFCDRGLPIVPGDRFVIRDVGRWETVAGGSVVDQSPPHLRRGDLEVLARLYAREGMRGAVLAEHVLVERRALPRHELAELTGASDEELQDAIARTGEWVTSDYVISKEHARTLPSKTADALKEFHESNPLAAGMPVEDLSRVLEVDRAVVGELIGPWQKGGVIVRDGNVVRLPDRGTQLTPEQRSEADRALAALRRGGPSPPGLRELGVPRSLAKALERSGEIVLVTPDIAYPADVWSGIRDHVVELISTKGPATVAQVRESVSTSRKYAVPLLEHLDATGITRRNGDVRELGPRGKELSARLE
jgi:selenocysteine-specific elongation factor